jgi:hypothetical protein
LSRQKFGSAGVEMNSLIVIAAGSLPFDRSAIKAVLHQSPGVEGFVENDPISGSLWWEYNFRGGSSIVKLIDSDKAISFSDLGDASLNLAIELQRHLPMPLIAFDSGYSFEVNLQEIHSIEEFRRRMD